MIKIKLISICICSILIIACVPLRRGVDGSTYVSSAQPAFSIAVQKLELRTSGRFNASVTTSNSLSGVAVDTWIAVYGGKTIEQPMAIVAQSKLKIPYYWDSDLTKINSINKSKVFLGDFTFQACTYLISDVIKDGFAPLSFDMAELEVAKHAQSSTGPMWIVRRFATRMDFERGKITLEYREKAPDNFLDMKALPLGAQSFLEAFEQRALKAFSVGAWQGDVKNIQTDYPQNISLRHLNTNFFGTISYNEPYD